MENIHSVNFHDASFNGIQVEQGRAELLFQLSDGALVKVVLEGLKNLLCNDFREGNIVLEMFVSGGVNNFESLLEALFPTPAGMLDKHYKFMGLMREKLINGELIILHVSPSYGGELIALCERAGIVGSN